MSAKLIDSLIEQLSRANHEWPQDSWFSGDKHARTLASRIARVVGDTPIEFAIAKVLGDRPDEAEKVFSATVFTADAVIAGSMAAKENGAYPPSGDVTIVPRAAIRSLVLNHVENFEDETAATLTYFTAAYEGLTTPIVVDRQVYRYQNHGRAGQLFDDLRADLLRKQQAQNPQ